MNDKAKRAAVNLSIVAVLYLAGMLAVYGFSVARVSTLVVFPMFILGIVIASLESDSGAWGAGLGVFYLLSYDLLFTEPFYELKVLNRTDVVSLGIFLLVALIMNMVTQRMRKQVEIAEQNVLVMKRLGKLEEENRKAKIRAEKEEFKTLLLQSVSHDLRTPLTSISANADYLLRSDTTDEKTRKELLGSIVEDATWLNNMVENLLSMTRVQDEDVALDKTPEIVDEIVGEAVRRMERRKGGHELSVHLPEEIIVAPMNARLIVQVLVNLIDNAIKHSTPDSFIEVLAWKDKEVVWFAVSDNGGGIGSEDSERLFARFYATEHTDGGRRGIGLGLSICKAIVEAHGGTMTVRNNQQGGATFEFALPLEEIGNTEAGK